MNESGGHRWQRVPPTEKRNRVHTSTVTVVILDGKEKNFELNINEVDIKYTRGSGAGGQHRNKVETAVILTHKPTGISVRVENRRKRSQNEKEAWNNLKEKLEDQFKIKHLNKLDETRKEQKGLGLRCEKRRTYRVRDNIVHDHVNKKFASFDKVMKGHIRMLHIKRS